jgi:hypothetical protein
MCKKLLEGGAPGRAEHSIGTQKLTQIFPVPDKNIYVLYIYSPITLLSYFTSFCVQRKI